MYATAAPCCKFATIVLAVELRCDLSGAVAFIRSMGPVCLGADSARLLRTLSELPGLSLAFSQSGTLQHGEVKVPSAKGDEQWQQTGPMRGTFMTFSPVIVEVAPRMNHGERRRILTHTCPPILKALTNGNARKPSYPCRAMDRQPAHPFLVLLWLLTPTRSHSLPAMIRQKVCRTRGNGSSCPKPLTFFVVELKIRPEKENTKGEIPPVVVPSRCIISGTSQGSGRHDERKVERSIPILILTPSCGDGGKATNPMARSTDRREGKPKNHIVRGPSNLSSIMPLHHRPWIIVILLAVDDEDHRHSSESDTSLAVMSGPPPSGDLGSR
ncbi:hypothetical protein BO85DRAFT_472364 [Aspergillus piperis CBS 112811]|uniref:Uncharacterized protein n=1 Tax=Aspergillus piperis CBS 112811 TaxID=1448313 RepID=A0A8G1QSD3_9EURO|nr:hypothetical protein BO85DRAFT_472364 [Aspergillus piperis CBS 112811]RAH52749.1 hypothetical protein BO85DRAFT_472364 [Aspergillus piperis CBS 112811]